MPALVHLGIAPDVLDQLTRAEFMQVVELVNARMNAGGVSDV